MPNTTRQAVIAPEYRGAFGKLIYCIRAAGFVHMVHVRPGEYCVIRRVQNAR